jgi:hypothetical protein
LCLGESLPGELLGIGSRAGGTDSTTILCVHDVTNLDLVQ